MTPDGLTPLHLAAASGHAHVVAMLLEHCSRDALQPDRQDVRGCTSLHLASQHGHAGVVDLLLGDGLKRPNCRIGERNHGRTAMHLAAAAGHADVLKVFLAHKSVHEKMAYITDRDRRDNLELAVIHGSLPSVQALLRPYHYRCVLASQWVKVIDMLVWRASESCWCVPHTHTTLSAHVARHYSCPLLAYADTKSTIQSPAACLPSPR